MTLNLLLALFLFPASSGAAQGDSGHPRQKASLAAERDAPEPSYPFLERTFRSGLNRDQLRALGGNATPEQIAALMTPQQKADARQSLHEAEATATTPKTLKEIAQGYLILDERRPDKGQNVVRIAIRLKKLDSRKSDGFTLAAKGYFQMKDFPAAVEQAREALKRNPDDAAAWAALKLSEGRVGASETPKKNPKLEISLHPQDASISGADNSSLPIKPQVKVSPSKPPPTLTLVSSEIDSSRKKGGLPKGAVPLTAAGLVLTLGGIGWMMFRKRYGDAWLEKTKKELAIGATVVVVAAVVYAAWPYLPTVLSASGPTASRFAPALAGGGAMTGGGAVALEQAAVGVAKTGLIAGGVVGAKGVSDYISYSKSPQQADDESSKTTKHGGERLADQKPTRGGTLSSKEAKVARTNGRVLNQRDGGKVYLHEVEPGKFNIYIENEQGKMVTTFRHLRANKLQRLAKNYGWH